MALLLILHRQSRLWAKSRATGKDRTRKDCGCARPDTSLVMLAQRLFDFLSQLGLSEGFLHKGDVLEIAVQGGR